tara:strand:+ start:296 stop:463 length:168 start_codon:yes stop_codon:yes gene_type:complete
MHIANSDRPVIFYDLDVVISVGYRIKSHQGVQFRALGNAAALFCLCIFYTVIIDY